MAKVTVTLLAETQAMRRGIDETNSKLGNLGDSASKAGSVLKGAFVAAGAAMVGSKVIGFLGDSVAAARESNKVMAQTAAVLKSTGGVAGITGNQIGSLANSLALKTGVDDEAIQSNENLLLTFTNIRNEAGKGNDVFTQTTKTVLDMSVALGQSGKSSAIQLGKALNDPIKGVSALSKVGVSFTEQQKTQIKTLVDSGNTLKAQKVILGEVNKEFGGSAAAVATPAARLHVLVGNMQEAIGNALIPILDKLALYLVKNLPKWIATAAKAFKVVKAVLTPVVKVVAQFFAGLKSGQRSGSKFSNFIKNDLLPAAEAVKTLLVEEWTKIAPSVRDTFNSIKDIVKNVIGIITQEIKIDVAIIEFIWRHFGDTITKYIVKTFENVVMVIRGAFKVVAGVFKVFNAVLHGNWKQAWDGIKQIVSGVMLIVRGVFSQALNIMKTIARIALIAIGNLFKVGFNGILDLIKGVPDRIKGMVGLFKTAGTALMHGLVDGLRSAAGAVGDIGKSIANSLIGYLNGILPHNLSINKGPIHVNVPLFPTIPMLANGGIAYGPTLALIGEAGPEAVVPLNKNKGGLGGNTYHITVNAPATLENFGETVVKAIAAAEAAGMVGYA